MVKKLKRSVLKRDVERHAFSGGIVFAFFFILISLISKFTGALGPVTNIFSGLFAGIGYDFTYFGIFLGLIYSFILGFIVSGIYSWIYNKLPGKI